MDEAGAGPYPRWVTGNPEPSRPVVRGIALMAVAALAVGSGVAMRAWRVPPDPAAPPGQPTTRSSGAVAKEDERAIEQALRLTPGFVPEKSRRVERVGGVNLALLTPPRRRLFIDLANAERCTCGCGYTLAGCRAYDSTCQVSLPRVRALFDSVRHGLVMGGASRNSTRRVAARDG